MKFIYVLIFSLGAVLALAADAPTTAPVVPKGPRYVVTLEIRQTHFTLSPVQHIKDASNAIKLDIPVDRAFYDVVEVGTVLNNDFRAASFLLHGSAGNWKVSVADKKVDPAQ